MCEILNVHVQKVDNGMGSIPVSRLKKEQYQIGIVLFFEPCQGSKVRCLRSAWKISEAKGNTYLFRFV